MGSSHQHWITKRSLTAVEIDEVQSRLTSNPGPHEARLGLVRAKAFVALFLFAAFTGLAIREQVLPLAIPFGLFFGLIALALLNMPRVIVDDIGITVVELFHCHQLRWSEVHTIIENGRFTQLSGDDKSLTIPSPSTWEIRSVVGCALYFWLRVAKGGWRIESRKGKTRSPSRGTRVQKDVVFPDKSRWPTWSEPERSESKCLAVRHA